eukprot:1586277-Karenia_brevis.AAC.1
MADHRSNKSVTKWEETENKNEAQQMAFLAHAEESSDYHKYDPHDIAPAVQGNCQCMAAWDAVTRRKPHD